ncbi:MAG: ABC transporter ATP-binding protein [Symbiobacteriia bacterium]
MQHIVEAEGLYKVYHLGSQSITALGGVDLVLQQGEFVAVMGRSGSGKSTLLHILGCLDRPSSGRLRLGGLEVGRLLPNQLPAIRRHKVGFVFQRHNVLPSLTALENVMLPLRYSREGPAAARQRALALLQEVGLLDRADHRPGQLSGGEQQRVALARALVNEPELILADEPTGELDSQTARQMVALMRRLNRERGQTFLIITHDPAVSESTDRTIHMLDGRIVGAAAAALH